jgi:CubicO group peptidase (beta-lactamase class C family)
VRLSVLAVALLVPAYALAQSDAGARPADPAFRSLDSTVASLVRDSQVPGLAVGVVRDGRLVFANGYGVRRLGSPAPVTTRSLFHMASVTKPFVATAIMQLVERGSVKLDAPVATYLPYFRVKDTASARITVRQMLTHTSGMRDVTDYRWDHPEYDDGALERYVRGLADSTLLWPPGTRFRYSNIAFEVLADVIAKVSGVPFETYMRREILVPVGMRSSTLMKPEADTSLLTSPHVQGSAGTSVAGEHFPYNRPHAASSTLVSNIEDMSRWALVNLQRGTIDGRQILRPSSYEVLWSPQVGTNAPPGSVSGDSVGLSWFLGRLDGRRTVVHSGGDNGYRSYLILVPDARVAVVIMTNSERSSVLTPVVRRALDAALGKTPPR